MAINTYPHIIEELRRTANPKDKAGFRELADSMDMKVSSLGNLLNPYADREVVKVGLEQAIHIMKTKKDYSAFFLLADELGFAAIPMYAKPDKATVHEEMLDNVQAEAALQGKILTGASQGERVLQMAKVFDEEVQTETAIRESEGQMYVPGQGWVKCRVPQ